jgi:uncharacterized coiled-coil protein SlyX
MLAEESQELRQALAESQDANDRLAGELSAAMKNFAEAERLAAQCQTDGAFASLPGRQVTGELQSSRKFGWNFRDAIMAIIGPQAPIAEEVLAGDREHRIAELECAVALLKERLASIASPMTENSPPTPAVGPAVTAPLLKLTANESKLLSSEPAGQGQCTAITQKGTRCKRAAGANGRCWQHATP